LIFEFADLAVEFARNAGEVIFAFAFLRVGVARTLVRAAASWVAVASWLVARGANPLRVAGALLLGRVALPVVVAVAFWTWASLLFTDVALPGVASVG